MSIDNDVVVDALGDLVSEAIGSVVSFERVAERTGLGVPALRERFGTPADMYFSVVFEGFRDFTDDLTRAAESVVGGTARLDAFIRGTVSYFRDNPRVQKVIRLGVYAPQMAAPTRLGFTRENLNAKWHLNASKPMVSVATGMTAEWGDDLPTGQSPRRSAWATNLAMIGHMAITGFAEATGDPLLHSEEDIIDDISRMSTAPLIMIKQLGALNEVSAELAAVRSAETLMAKAPRLLASSLDVNDPAVLVARGERLRLATVDGIEEPSRESLPALVAGALETGETRVEEAQATPAFAVPIDVGNERLGVVFGRVPSPRDLERGIVARIETFATMVGLALENVHLYENLKDEVDARTRELREAQANLVRAAKLASLGQLVAGVSHDLNTPLGALKGAQGALDRGVEKLGGEGRAFEVVKRSSATIATAVERVASVVDRLKRFARLDQAEIQRCDVHECIDDAIRMLQSSTPEGVHIERAYGELTQVMGRPLELNDLFFNLVMNAVQAIDGEGTVTVRTSEGDEQLLITIEDDGSGIAEDDLPRIFDPGFTTRGVGVGAGLGLATCHQVVRGHDGAIDVTTELGRGTTVTVSLPRTVSALTR